MSEPRRSTRARAREDGPPSAPPEPAETPSKTSTKSLKRKRPAPTPKDATPARAPAEKKEKTPENTLPLKLVDGQPLPTLPEPQPLDLPASEWQDVRQSGVLSTSLQRSRAVWISGSNFRLFHAYFTPPKKVADRTDADKQAMQRQKDIIRNFPQLGGTVEAQLVIEPHTFPIRLYGPREYVRQTQKKAPPPQYGQWPNHNQYPPYHQHPQPYSTPPAPYVKPPPPPPPPRPSQPKPQQKPPPPPPSNPAPDPVIQALAQRAGTDPELKAVMKIVASGQATQQQLAFFQGHIAELTAKLEKQKAEAARAAPPAPPPQPQSQPPPPPVPHHQPPPPPPQQPQQQPPVVSQPPHVTQPPPMNYHPPPTPPIPPPHTPQPPAPAPPPQQQQHHHHHHHHHPPPTPYHQPPMTPSHHQHAPPPQMTPQVRPPHPNQYTYSQPRQQMYNQPPPPPRTSYRPLVFDFVEGNGDKFYLPSYSFMEWIGPNGAYQGVKLSCLLTKMRPKPKQEPKNEDKVPATPAPKGGNTAGGPGPAGKAQGTGTPNPSTIANGTVPATPTTNGNPQSVANPTPAPTPHNHPPSNTNPNLNNPSTPAPHVQPAQPVAPTPSTPQYTPAPRIEDFDEKKDIPDIDVYCPVTICIYSQNLEILQSLPRAVRPPDVVTQYMDDVFDKCQRAEETFLAFRLPKEKVDDAGAGERREVVDLGAVEETAAKKMRAGGKRASVAV